MELAHPWFLALAAIICLLPLLERHSLANLSAKQRKVCLALRVLILLLLVGSLAGLRWLLPSRELAVVFAVDGSASISVPAAQEARNFVAACGGRARGQDTMGVVGFAREAVLWETPAKDHKLAAKWPEIHDRQATAIGPALDFASALFPAGAARRLVLLSDGNDTAGGAGEAAARLSAAGIEVFTVPLHNATPPEVLVEHVEVPRRLQQGEAFDLVAHLHSNVATTAKVRVFQNQFQIEQREVTLKPGDNEFRVPNLHGEGNFISYEVEVIPAVDTVLENNRASVTATLRGQPKVLIVETEEAKARPLAEALRADKMTVEMRGVTGAPATLEDLQQFDLFLLSDVSALRLTRRQMELYQRWVQEFGGGFVLIGGENSFGVGGYYRTAIEQMLPVRMDHDDRLDTPTVALLVVLDRSGSMSAQAAGTTKIALADQGAVFAMNVLQSRDIFGVTAVDTRPHIVAPLAQIAGKTGLEQKIMSITAGGGGIYIYTSLVDAYQQLREVNARIKHVILFSDAADAEEKAAGEMADGAKGLGNSFDLVAAMLAAKITTSVVGLGIEQDKDTPFLRQLAERGSGRFYLTNDATTLPQIFSTETMKVAQSSMIEEPFLAVPAKPSPFTAGLDWAQSPLLLGYNATKAKPTAEVLLTTERGEPLLATWRFGLGQTAAFTSDAKARWAAEWLQWPGYGKFWAQVARGLMRKSGPASFEVATHEAGDRLQLEIDAITPEGEFRNQMPINVHLLNPAGKTQTVVARQTAPGRYEAAVDLPSEGSSLISVNSPQLPDGGVVIGHARSYPREFLTSATDETLLRQIATVGGGKFAPSPDEVVRLPEKVSRHARDLSDWFLVGALVLFPLDIWLRRRTWRGIKA